MHVPRWIVYSDLSDGLGGGISAKPQSVSLLAQGDKLYQ